MTPHVTLTQKKTESPLVKYLGTPPRGKAMPSIKVPSVINLVFDCYAKKTQIDEVNDREGVRITA